MLAMFNVISGGGNLVNITLSQETFNALTVSTSTNDGKSE